jgi:hypothetical protein
MIESMAGRRWRTVLRNVLRAGLAAAFALAWGPALAQAPLIEKPSGDWTSGVDRDDLELRFSAATLATAHGARVALAFDRFAGACEALSPSLGIEIPYPSTQSVVIMDSIGFLRVDENPIRMIRFNARVHEGETVIFMEITRILGHGDLVTELRRGRALRFKLGTERTTYYLRFSLMGFSSAAARSLQLCREHDRALRASYPVRQPKPGGTEDRDYFED